MLADNVMGLKFLKQKCGMWLVFFFFLRFSEAAFLEDGYHIKEFGHLAFFLQKLSEKKGLQKLRRTCGSVSSHF